PTERHLGYRHILKTMTELAKEVCDSGKCQLKSIKGIGLSLPGPVNPNTKVMDVSNTMILADRKIHDDLKKALKVNIPIESENDANCFAIAETFCGAGLEHFKKTKIPVY